MLASNNWHLQSKTSNEGGSSLPVDERGFGGKMKNFRNGIVSHATFALFSNLTRCASHTVLIVQQYKDL
jgi:hypothetical protein